MNPTIVRLSYSLLKNKGIVKLEKFYESVDD